ncbi:MAG: DUF1508 domain-containing protein [Comamonadaceae bacterium]|nr:MAG: DUF1508 domain-containing protein [Comamonadaceae bacterium]
MPRGQMQFFVMEREDGKWAWELRADGEVLAVSAARYSSPQAVLRAIDLLKAGVKDAEMPEGG